MKYMGSKRAMLANGLGEALSAELAASRRFVDLFTGSAAVAWHVAQAYEIPVVACDLQQFSVSLAGSVLSRVKASSGDWIEIWFDAAIEKTSRRAIFHRAVEIQKGLHRSGMGKAASAAQDLCLGARTPIAAAYGGYYFSPLQALHFDALRSTLPPQSDHAKIALASLIQAASSCSASPGHTAQPFKPNRTAGPFVFEAWSRDVFGYVRRNVEKLAPMHARIKGSTKQGDAAKLATRLQPGDLVFVDPPYSGVQYSRFYHVLEMVANGVLVPVSGAGRYPSVESRPRSDYSLISKSGLALKNLLRELSGSGCTVLLTFPAGDASNGLSGQKVIEAAGNFFNIKSIKVGGKFSTLGGNRSNREARQDSSELILTLKP